MLESDYRPAKAQKITNFSGHFKAQVGVWFHVAGDKTIVILSLHTAKWIFDPHFQGSVRQAV
jgi:hypothetical protein